MREVDLVLEMARLRNEQPDFGENHIRSVEQLVVGTTVRIFSTNGEVTDERFEEVVAVDQGAATSNPQARSIITRTMPSVSRSGLLTESVEMDWRPCDLGLAPYSDPRTAPFGADGARLVWNTTAVFAVPEEQG